MLRRGVFVSALPALLLAPRVSAKATVLLPPAFMWAARGAAGSDASVPPSLVPLPPRQ